VRKNNGVLDHNGEFWKQRYCDKETEASNLRLQLWNLRRERDILEKTAKSLEDTIQKNKTTSRTLILPAKFATWESELKEYTSLSLGETYVFQIISIFH